MTGRRWHGPDMTNEKKPAPRAAGGVLALCILGGAGVGVALGQSTIGLLGGFAIGGLIALLFWLNDRKR